MSDVPKDALVQLAKQMRANSERWFPLLHAEPPAPMEVFYALGMAGEAGEVANVVKKMMRHMSTPTCPKCDSDDREVWREGFNPDYGMKSLCPDAWHFPNKQDLGDELADVFTYLLLLADECGIDIMEAYERKREECERRWG